MWWWVEVCCGLQKEEEQRRVQEKKTAAEERKDLELQRRQREVGTGHSLWRPVTLCVCVCAGRARCSQGESSRCERPLTGGTEVSLHCPPQRP